jgi:hypothetical protein
MTDPCILAARFFYVVALLLTTYLLACGANALYEAARRWIHRRGEP